MACIDLFKAAQRTVKPASPHEQAAWNWLQEQLTADQLRCFAEIFQAEPPLKLPLQQELSSGRRP
jgi:hypothetical protein